MPRPRLLRAGWGGARPTAATTPRRRGPHFARAITTRARVGPPRTRGRPGLRRLRPDQSARRHGQVRARQPSPVDSWCGALLVEPGSSHQSGDRAARTRPGDRRPPAQGPPREPTPDPNRTPGSRLMSKSVAKAPEHPTHCRQNRGIMRFHLGHPNPAAAFATDLDNQQPLDHPQPDGTRPTTPNEPEHTRRGGPARRARHSPRAESPGHPPRPRTRADRPGGRSPRASRPQPDRGAAPGRLRPRRGLQHPPVAAPPFGRHREYPSHRHHPFLTWWESDRPGETGE